jgi:hypothetical protein
VDRDLNVQHVCIHDNPQVTIDGFVGYLQDDFKRYGISTEVIGNQPPPHCKNILYYTARRSWDMTTFMSTAELRLTQNGRLIAKADWHLKGKGGFSLTKYRGTESKLNDMVDELLADYEPVSGGQLASEQDDSIFSTNIDAELKQLEQLASSPMTSSNRSEKRS